MNSNLTFLTFMFVLLICKIKAQSSSNFNSNNEICKSRNGITNEDAEAIFTFVSNLISTTQKCFLSCLFRSHQIVRKILNLKFHRQYPSKFSRFSLHILITRWLIMEALISANFYKKSQKFHQQTHSSQVCIQNTAFVDLLSCQAATRANVLRNFIFVSRINKWESIWELFWHENID